MVAVLCRWALMAARGSFVGFVMPSCAPAGPVPGRQQQLSMGVVAALLWSLNRPCQCARPPPSHACVQPAGPLPGAGARGGGPAGGPGAGAEEGAGAVFAAHCFWFSCGQAAAACCLHAGLGGAGCLCPALGPPPSGASFPPGRTPSPPAQPLRLPPCRCGARQRRYVPTTWPLPSGSSLCRQGRGGGAGLRQGAAGCVVPWAELCGDMGSTASRAGSRLHVAAWRSRFHHCRCCLAQPLFLLPSRTPQGYQAGGGARRAASAGGAGGPAMDPADLEAGAVVGKYMAQYEQSINPFAGGWRVGGSGFVGWGGGGGCVWTSSRLAVRAGWVQGSGAAARSTLARGALLLCPLQQRNRPRLARDSGVFTLIALRFALRFADFKAKEREARRKQLPLQASACRAGVRQRSLLLRGRWLAGRPAHRGFCMPCLALPAPNLHVNGAAGLQAPCRGDPPGCHASSS